MREQSLEGTAEETARLLGPRAVPNARFTHMLREDIYHAAYQKMGRPSSASLQSMVVELRKLVHLLRKTLIPVCPPQSFVNALERDLETAAREMIAVRQQRMRLLMLGGMLGSAISILWVIAAALLRRRNGRAHA